MSARECTPSNYKVRKIYVFRTTLAWNIAQNALNLSKYITWCPEIHVNCILPRCGSAVFRQCGSPRKSDNISKSQYCISRIFVRHLSVHQPLFFGEDVLHVRIICYLCTTYLTRKCKPKFSLGESGKFKEERVGRHLLASYPHVWV